MRSFIALGLLVWSVLSFSAETLSVTVDALLPQFTISLPANPTTGFKWVVKQYDTTHFNFIKDEYKAAEPTRMGSGGQTVFRFARKQGVNYPHCAKMTFRYQRAWQVNSGTDTDVTIRFKTPSKK